MIKNMFKIADFDVFQELGFGGTSYVRLGVR